MIKFVLLFVLHSTGDQFALATGLEGNECIARLTFMAENSLGLIGNLSCSVDDAEMKSTPIFTGNPGGIVFGMEMKPFE